MTDLTYCYLHMTDLELEMLDYMDLPDYLAADLSDEELGIPEHMIPPNPDESDTLPSQMHISYPYGDPTKLTHPASRPHRGFNRDSRALYEDMGYGGAGVNAGLEWKELALDLLLPVDPDKEEAARAEMARRLASGANQNQAPAQEDNPGGQQQAQEQEADDGGEEEEEVEEHEQDENTFIEDSNEET